MSDRVPHAPSLLRGRAEVVRRETRDNPALDEYWVVAVRVQRV
jgi:hypothetical protein